VAHQHAFNGQFLTKLEQAAPRHAKEHAGHVLSGEKTVEITRRAGHDTKLLAAMNQRPFVDLFQYLKHSQPTGRHAR